MKVLVADDDHATLDMTKSLLEEWGYKVVGASNGADAWKIIQEDDAPSMVVADWRMPGMDGDELCRKARTQKENKPLYIILVTAKTLTLGDKVSGLTAGADDYLTKPWALQELRARLKTGERVLKLQMELRRRVHELEQALVQVKQLRGLLPICAHCKKIRDDKNYWHSVENYISANSSAEFTHGICPACLEEQITRFNDKKKKSKS